jgi:hydrogenase-4 component F
MIWAILLLPLVAAAWCMALPRSGLRRAVLLAAATGHAVLVAMCWRSIPPAAAAGWLSIDALGLLFLSITSLLFLAAAVYGAGYLNAECGIRNAKFKIPNSEFRIPNSSPGDHGSEKTFLACLLVFLSAMSLVSVSRHLGLVWVAVELTTLASAPLIYFHRQPRSLEATWKYLLICSVGIALAMLGNFFLAVAASGNGAAAHLTIESLAEHAANLNKTWLKAAFILCLVGYGTKMGLAPMHTWLPDAHSEAPSTVSALLSAALLNCAFLAVLRFFAVASAAGLGDFARSLMLLIGLFSMVLAGLFLINQVDYKRMLAYSSVENMGILAVGIGLGGTAAFGAMLHAANHSLAKGALFLVAGNILAAYGTKSVADVRGLLSRRPITGVLWLAGLLAVLGMPPFGSFISELTILSGAVAGGQYVAAGIYLLALGVAFAAVMRVALPMAMGGNGDRASGTGYREEDGDRGSGIGHRERLWSIVPPIALACGALLLGLYIPPALNEVLRQAAELLGGTQ